MGKGQRSQAGLRPVDDAFAVQVLQAAADLGRVEDGSGLVEACVAHVVDVELEVATVHERQDEAQRLLRLIGVRQTHLHNGGGGGGGRSFVFLTHSRWTLR